VNAYQRWECGTCKDWGTVEDTDALCPENCAAAVRIAAARGRLADQRRPAARPYETIAEAAADAQHVYEASRRENERGTMGRINEGLLLAALAAAGVELGGYDRRIAGWLADWEPETVQVVLGWIERAHAERDGGAS
jgi:hypothetical protein